MFCYFFLNISRFSLEADDSESELIGIPESDLSDSTLHGSANVSICNLLQFTAKQGNSKSEISSK